VRREVLEQDDVLEQGQPRIAVGRGAKEHLPSVLEALSEIGENLVAAESAGCLSRRKRAADPGPDPRRQEAGTGETSPVGNWRPNDTSSENSNLIAF
jgi:hypothetical protein